VQPEMLHIAGSLTASGSLNNKRKAQQNVSSGFSSHCYHRAIFPIAPGSCTGPPSRKAVPMTNRLQYNKSETVNAPFLYSNSFAQALRSVRVTGKPKSDLKRMPVDRRQVLPRSNCHVLYNPNPAIPLTAAHFLMKTSPLLKLSLASKLRPAPGSRLTWYTDVKPRARLLGAEPPLVRGGNEPMHKQRDMQAQTSPIRSAAANCWARTSLSFSPQSSASAGLQVLSVVAQTGSTTPRDYLSSKCSGRRHHRDYEGSGTSAASSPGTPVVSFGPVLQSPRSRHEHYTHMATGAVSFKRSQRPDSAHQGFPYRNAGNAPGQTQSIDVILTSSPQPRRLHRQRGQQALALAQQPYTNQPPSATKTHASETPVIAASGRLRTTRSQRSDNSPRGTCQTQRQPPAGHVHSFMQAHGVPVSGLENSFTNSPGWYPADASLGIHLPPSS
jgi:hypothetical protein